VSLAVVRDLRAARPAPTPEQLDAFEQDLVAGFVLARSAARLTDESIRRDVGYVMEFRESMGRYLWTARPDDVDRYLAVWCKGQAHNTLRVKAQGIAAFWQYLELRHKAEIHALTGEVVACPVDEMNRPSGNWRLNVRVPPTDAEIRRLFDGWREDLVSSRKYLPAARNFCAARLWCLLGTRIGETHHLDMTDVNWDLGKFGKLHVRFGKGARGRGPKPRMVSLINGGRELITWFVEDVRGQFDDAWDQPGAPLLPSERHGTDSTCTRASKEALRSGLDKAVARHLPAWKGRLTPHVLRHYCASSLYHDGMDIVAIQELLGHDWIATTMGYVHVHRAHVDDSWIRAATRSATRLERAKR